MAKTPSPQIQLAVMANDVQYIKQEVTEINKKLAQDYVQKAEFDPIKKIVYGMVALILMAVVGALVALVVSPR